MHDVCVTVLVNYFTAIYAQTCNFWKLLIAHGHVFKMIRTYSGDS